MDFSILNQDPYKTLLKIFITLLLVGFVTNRVMAAAEDFMKTKDIKSIFDEAAQIFGGIVVGVTLLVLPVSFVPGLIYGVAKFVWNTLIVTTFGTLGIPLPQLP